MLVVSVQLVLLILNVQSVFFLLVRWQLLLAFLKRTLRVARWLCSSQDERLTADEQYASQFLQDVRWAVRRGLQVRIRSVVSIFVVATAVCMSSLSTLVAPLTVAVLVIKDILTVLLRGAPRADGLKWRQDRHGVRVGYHPPRYENHVTITGGVSLAAYTSGVLHAVYERYGIDAFSGCDFSGASSGSWTAACAAFAACGCRDIQQFFDLIFISACQLTELCPLGLYLVGCDAIKEVVNWSMALAEAEFPEAREAVINGGRLGVWLCGVDIRHAWPLNIHGGIRDAFYRLVVRSGDDFSNRDRIGDVLAASSVFPYFTRPELCSKAASIPAALDGYFPGKGVDFLPVPDMPAGNVGTTILFDMSGGLKKVYANEKNVWVVPLREWRDFKLADWSASSASAYHRLFQWGVNDAGEHWPELDRMMLGALGARPRVQKVSVH